MGLELALPAGCRERHRLALEAEDGAETTVAGQALLLHELLTNLTDNAIHYTPPGGSVLLRVRRVREGVLLEVLDSGPGIDEAEADKVFMPFYRAQAALETNPGGTGLGLAIVRDIARVHGASVTLGPAGGGSGLEVRTVSFQAPAPSPPAARPNLLCRRYRRERLCVCARPVTTTRARMEGLPDWPPRIGICRRTEAIRQRMLRVDKHAREQNFANLAGARLITGHASCALQRR